MTTLADLRAATFAARARTNEKNLGTQVKQGLFRIVVIAKEGRRVSEIPASDWMGGSQVVAALNAMANQSTLAQAMASAAIRRAA